MRWTASSRRLQGCRGRTHGSSNDRRKWRLVTTGRTRAGRPGSVKTTPEATSVEVVLACTDLDAMTRFFIEDVGFRIATISPADNPREIALFDAGSGDAGGRVRLRRGDVDAVGHVLVRRAHVPAGSPVKQLTAPNGTIVEIASASLDVVVPDNEPSLTIVKAPATVDAAFGVGRAGMGYRDLLPDRWGGRFIASHILIADGGEVADYVHFHRIRFQMIFVAAGWVEVVYEDQGEPFRMEAGDCVLQPAEIRHRVLRSSPGLEVIEIGCPAEHDTVAEHTITLPTSRIDRDRDFDGQRFVRHVAAGAKTVSSVCGGFAERDTGIGAATNGLAGARVLTASDSTERAGTALTHDGEFAMNVVLSGSATLTVERRNEQFGPRDAVTFPAGAEWTWSQCSSDFELLDVTLPDRTIRLVGR
jgi:mannose-6-phosphate isomerase-like protein (cupin superfamily)